MSATMAVMKVSKDILTVVNPMLSVNLIMDIPLQLWADLLIQEEHNRDQQEIKHHIVENLCDSMCGVCDKSPGFLEKPHLSMIVMSVSMGKERQ